MNMKWLIWREYRLNRLILITGAVLLLLPYVVVLTRFSYSGWSRIAQHPDVMSAAFGWVARYSIVLSQLTLALLGGNAMAGERADRSAEFMAYVPVSRPQRLVAKLSIVPLVVMVIWGMNAMIVAMIASTSGSPLRMPTELWQVCFYAAMTGLTFFCVGWLVSSFQSSPTFAVVAGLATPLTIIMGLGVLDWSDVVPPLDEIVGPIYAILCATLAVASFAIGTWYFLRRVEP
jgi:ABC-type transport system involved in multi-copper enzyme maturation permease subunit